MAERPPAAPVGRRRAWAACAIALALVCGCGTRNDSDKVAAPSRDGSSAAATTSDGKESSMSTAASPDELIRKTVARARGLSPDALKVTILDAGIPGITVFSARQTGVHGPGATYDAGVVVGNEVIVDRAEAMARVARAWGYGPERTVPPAQVAKVIGFLEGVTESTAPVVTQDDLTLVKKTFRKPFADRATLPVETTVDGLPAVQYGNRGDGRPFRISTAIFHPGGKVEVRVEDIPL